MGVSSPGQRKIWRDLSHSTSFSPLEGCGAGLVAMFHVKRRCYHRPPPPPRGTWVPRRQPSSLNTPMSPFLLPPSALITSSRHEMVPSSSTALVSDVPAIMATAVASAAHRRAP